MPALVDLQLPFDPWPAEVPVALATPGDASVPPTRDVRPPVIPTSDASTRPAPASRGRDEHPHGHPHGHPHAHAPAVTRRKATTRRPPRSIDTLSLDELFALLSDDAVGARTMRDTFAAVGTPDRPSVHQSLLDLLARFGATGTLPAGDTVLSGRLAGRLAAALELGRRLARHERTPRAKILGPRQVFDFMRPTLGHLEVEEFHVLLIDAKQGVLRDVTVTRGLVNSALVHPREIFKPAMQDACAAVILCHNHPSGDPTPSPEDRAITAQLVAAGRLVDIQVQDHIIVGANGYYSFGESNAL